MALFRRVPDEVGALLGDDRALAWSATDPDGWLAAGEERLVSSAGFDERWVAILGASWDAPLLEVTVWKLEGAQVERIVLPEAGVLPQVIRERITQSLLVQQHVTLRGKRGVRFLARRDPATDEVSWQRVLDPGIDPTDPQIRAEIAQAQARLADIYGV